MAHPLDRWTSQAQLQQTLSLRCWTDWRLHPGIQMTLLRGNEKEARSASGPATSFLPVVPVPSHHACHARTGHDDLTRLTRAVHCLPAGPAQSSRSHSLLWGEGRHRLRGDGMTSSPCFLSRRPGSAPTTDYSHLSPVPSPSPSPSPSRRKDQQTDRLHMRYMI
jgi:hypothetical protein